ncbi:ferredoxin [Streptomyces sp. NPDC001292]|uniref:ferredoxin n=1 Tax=Streptomyces sp. NPDC001292 TaxID=3364558 RepID=UPI00368B6ED6
MRFVIDLRVCQDHGQCAYASSAFRLDEHGKLAFRREAEQLYISGEFDESARDPLQAIEIEG